MKNTAYFLVSAALILAALVYGQSLILPFIFASLFWFITREFRAALDKISFVKKYCPMWVKNTLVFFLMLFAILFMSDILISNITNLSSSYQQYQPNVQKLLNQIGDMLNINIMNSIESASDDFDFGNFLANLVNGISGILGNVFMIMIYALFVFLEESAFSEKFKRIFDNEEQYNKMNVILERIKNSVSDYLRLKTFVSFLTGILSFTVLALVGVDSPLFWAFLIFLLNYIPTIGSLIATIFPAAFSLIQFGAFGPFLTVLTLVGAVQLVIGNIVEPKVMGNSLNLSPLVTIIALALWGKIWGITGMVLSVPITVIMVIVFAQFPKTRTIAIMLSENGQIDDME